MFKAAEPCRCGRCSPTWAALWRRRCAGAWITSASSVELKSSQTTSQRSPSASTSATSQHSTAFECPRPDRPLRQLRFDVAVHPRPQTLTLTLTQTQTHFAFAEDAHARLQGAQPKVDDISDAEVDGRKVIHRYRCDRRVGGVRPDGVREEVGRKLRRPALWGCGRQTRRASCAAAQRGRARRSRGEEPRWGRWRTPHWSGATLRRWAVGRSTAAVTRVASVRLCRETKAPSPPSLWQFRPLAILARARRSRPASLKARVGGESKIRRQSRSRSAANRTAESTSERPTRQNHPRGSEAAARVSQTHRRGNAEQTKSERPSETFAQIRCNFADHRLTDGRGRGRGTGGGRGAKSGQRIPSKSVSFEANLIFGSQFAKRKEKVISKYCSLPQNWGTIETIQNKFKHKKLFATLFFKSFKCSFVLE
jgi:hypothetical protein